MFALGHVYIGNYIIWITTPVFTKIQDSSPEVLSLPYFEVLVTKTDWFRTPEDPPGNNRFILLGVDLMKDEEFKFLLSLNVRNQPTDQTDPLEYESYVNRKDMQRPLCKLSKKNVERLLAKCAELEKVSV